MTRALTAVSFLLAFTYSSALFAQVDFVDDFERADGLVDGWSVFQGQWSITSGKLHTAVSEGWIWAGEEPITLDGDFALSLDVEFPTIPNDGVGRHGGLMFFADAASKRDATSGYTLDWIDRAADHGFRLIRWDNGSFHIIVPSTPAIAEPPSNWQLTVIGDQIIVDADGSTVIDVIDGTYRMGHFGLWSFQNSEMLFDNVTIDSGAASIRACFSATPRIGDAPLEVDFDASCSSDGKEETIVSYAWSFGDGATASGSAPSHTFDDPGSYSVMLTLTGSSGTTVATSRTIDVLDPDDTPIDVSRILNDKVKRYGAEADSTVVFNELMYHPRSNEAGLEWFELYNQMAVDMDVSNWVIEDGVFYEIPDGTVIRGGGFLVIASDPAQLEAATGFDDALGPFVGRVDNSGERLSLFNRAGRLMASVRYRDGGDWPPAPDGSGVSLAKIDPLSAGGLGTNWASSEQLDGTPGAPNFPAGVPQPEAGNTTLAFNEYQIFGVDDYWVELVNYGDVAVSLAGYIVASGSLNEYTFPGGSLASGELLLLTRADLGFDVALDGKLFLYTPDGLTVIDAVKLVDQHRGRHPEGVGPWLYPTAPTLAAANSFEFEDDIVINEIHYHPRIEPAMADVTEETTFIPITASWRYNQSGENLGTAWRAPEFNDTAWPEGDAVLYRENGALPAPKNTELDLGPTTYYFRTSFELSGALEGQLQLRLLVDDGAVVYLNGVEVHRINMPDGTITSSTFADTGVSDATFTGPFSLAGESLVVGTNLVAVEVHQATSNSSDVVFAAELFARVVLEPGHPAREKPESWIELYNAGTQAVDLTGWEIDRGIDYAFEPGTVLQPDGYLVVAEDAELLRTKYPSATIVGNFNNRLSNRTDLLVLRDHRGNPADVVEYFDGGRWPAFADGGGSSLELRDVAANNLRGEAWAASDETVHTEWRTYSYREVAVANIGPTQWNEFVVGLLDAGEVLIDDIRVIQDPDGAAVELLQNEDFESGADAWRLLGNHRHSAVIDDPDDPGNRVLHVVATGSTEHMHNHLETTLVDNTPAPNGVEYEVSFRGRWLIGSNQLNTRLYFNRIPQTTLLDLPDRAGTPGAQNSAFENNIGPTFDRLRHDPVVPPAGEPISVTVFVEDPDSVNRVTLWWSENGGAWQSSSMSPVAGAENLFGALIPGQSGGRTLQFYVEAEDGLGAMSTFPAAGRDSRALIRVDDGQDRDGPIHNFRILMTAADANFLHADTNVMSNERLGATVVYREEEVFYDVACRLKGSQRGRPGGSRVSFSVRFQPDELFRGTHRTVSLDRSGGWGIGAGPTGQDEIVVKHSINQAGLPGMYDDLAWLVAPRSAQNGPTLVMMSKYSSLFRRTQYPTDSDGTTYKIELIYYPTTTVNGDPEGLKRPQPDVVLGTDLRDLGDDKEPYRWNFLIENNPARDDYSRFIELCKAMSSSGASFGPRMEEVLDIDEATRMYAVHTLCGISDTYWFAANFHNTMFYELPSQGRFVILGWDNDVAFTRSTSAAFWGGPNLARLYGIPEYERLFYGHLNDIVEDFFNLSYMQRWTDHYGELAQETGSFDTVRNYVNARSNFVKNALPSPVSFEITTNGGSDFEVDSLSTTIAGTGWIDIRKIAIAGFEVSPDVSWTTRERWSMTVPLVPGVNSLTFVAIDFSGNLLDSASIDVTSTVEFPPPELTSVIPNQGIPGDVVTLQGQGFQVGVEVLFDGVPATVVSRVDAQTVTVTVPNLAPQAVMLSVRNIDGKTSETVSFTVTDAAGRFIRGDANRDGQLDISDALATLFYLYHELDLTCLDAVDANDDEAVNLTDVLVTLDYIFLQGGAPPAPFPFPGDDTTGGGQLQCE